ncbi:allergen Cr-PI-like [Osmia bicornis bicornis]|uniref:allergen Cr-PI-like n=1 Tax=Osmia bicornis bicornis TaxID=1437191 RepID=UPI0010F61C32|nr:allergen Cr-PI-like [Osmia bicornis bicornis]XP_029048954.1 allergen Cr-PI-like [Osmia bicornis bicornis]
MRYLFVLLALVAFAACDSSKQRAADQELLKKQQDCIQLLQKITQDIPNPQLQNFGETYDIESNAHYYDNPIIVKYYAGVVRAGLVQPKGTMYSNSISQLRKEVALLYRILLDAKDYPTFLKTAAWARVRVNEGQFVKAVAAAILTRKDTQGVILPPTYEILPQYHLDARIIQEAQEIGFQQAIQQSIQNILIPVNSSATLAHEEQQLSYFTQDVGLASYYNYVNLASYILESEQQEQQQKQQQQKQPLGQEQYQQQIVGKYLQQGAQDQQNTIGHGAQYLYLHQQLLAHYELNRLSNGLCPIPYTDWTNVKNLYQPHLRTLNGLEFPGRPDNLQLKPQKSNLIKSVMTLEQRLMEAIDSGHVITPQGIFLSLYQPQGMNILGDLIEGCGRSVNPRYYGSLQAVARKLLGNAPEVENVWDYTPSALELGQTAVHDPAFYQLYKKVMRLYKQYQQSLPPYQSTDLILPGVTIQNVDVSQLITLFTNYFIDLDAVTVQRPDQTMQQQQDTVQQHVKAHLKRLDHHPYQYQVIVHSEQQVANAVVRVYLGPKHDYKGRPISISQKRHLFVELDQFYHNLHPGQNIIIRNSQQAPGQSADWPSVSQIQQGVSDAIRSQEPFYVTQPHQIFSFPARLSLPKGQQQGFPMQFVVVITNSGPLNVPYGPVIPDQALTFQEQQFQIVNPEQYQQLKQQSLSQMTGGIQQNVEVFSENLVNAQQQIEAVRTHYANVYTKYHGQYPYTQIQNPVGEGQDMTWIKNVAGVGGAAAPAQGLGLSGQYQPQMQQQFLNQPRGHYRQQRMSWGTPSAQGLQGAQQVGQGPEVVVGTLPNVQIGQHEQGSQHSVQGGHHNTQGGQQSVQTGPHSVRGGQGVQYGVPLQGGQGIQGMNVGLQGVSGLSGVGAQGVQAVKIAYGMEGAQGIGGVQSWASQVQGGIQGTGIVASGQQHAGGFQGVYAQPQTVQDQTVYEYYQNKPISEIIGGAISLDGKPLGFPLDRPLTAGALSVPNIFVKDVLVYHAGQPTNDITQ